MKLFFIAVTVVSLILAPMVAFCGCLPAQSPTNALRAAVVMTAEAVQQADHVCAEVGKANRDVALLTACKNTYNIARPALVTAQYYIDLGDERNTEQALCTGIKALSATVGLVKSAKPDVSIPPFITESLTFAGSLCHA